MTIKLYEVVRTDPISSGYSEIDADGPTEAAIFAAIEEVRKTVLDGFSFDGFRIDVEKPNRAVLYYKTFEGTDGETDAIAFEGIRE